MNRTQNTVKWMLVGLLICGIAAAAMIFKVGNPRVWAPIGMMAAGIVGFLIALMVWENLNKPRKENCLRTKAWRDFGFCMYGFIVGGVSLFYLIRNAEKRELPTDVGVRLVMLLPVVVLGAWVAIGPYVRKKRLLLGLDERERLIYEKAQMISNSVYTGLSFIVYLGLPVWYGLITPVAVYIPVCAFVAIAFVAEIVKPLIILIQCKRENSEGDAV